MNKLNMCLHHAYANYRQEKWKEGIGEEQTEEYCYKSMLNK